MAAIHSAFVSAQRRASLRSPNWVMPEKCEHLTRVMLRELETKAFHIVKKTA
jgi:hypothetical protein